MNNLEKMWFETSARNRDSAKSMIKSGHYTWALFVWHLSLEKLLKGIIAQETEKIPFIHNLSKIAKQVNIDFTEEQLDHLDEITTFNLEARYDDYKYEFYKKATKEYAAKWNAICEKLYLWIQKHKK
jgi:HEPN domain-containing protein